MVINALFVDVQKALRCNNIKKYPDFYQNISKKLAVYWRKVGLKKPLQTQVKYAIMVS